MEKTIFRTVIAFVVLTLILNTIGKYYEVQKYKKSIQNLELEHEILLKQKKLIENGK